MGVQETKNVKGQQQQYKPKSIDQFTKDAQKVYRPLFGSFVDTEDFKSKIKDINTKDDGKIDEDEAKDFHKKISEYRLSAKDFVDVVKKSVENFNKTKSKDLNVESCHADDKKSETVSQNKKNKLYGLRVVDAKDFRYWSKDKNDFYSKSSIDKIDGRVYDKDGKLLQITKKGEPDEDGNYEVTTIRFDNKSDSNIRVVSYDKDGHIQTKTYYKGEVETTDDSYTVKSKKIKSGWTYTTEDGKDKVAISLYYADDGKTIRHTYNYHYEKTDNYPNGYAEQTIVAQKRKFRAALDENGEIIKNQNGELDFKEVKS